VFTREVHSTLGLDYECNPTAEPELLKL